MIIVVEGPSAAGKTTWATTHCRPDTVVGEATAGPAPDRDVDPDGSAAYWARVNAERWRAATLVERATGTAVCDTDPLKLHYVWSLWRIGAVDARQWRAELTANRRLFAQKRLGVADLILVAIPDPATLAARRDGDSTRRRRNFDTHARLAEPLREWYQAVERLDPHRVRWDHPAAGIPGTVSTARPNRAGTEIFDALIGELPAR